RRTFVTRSMMGTTGHRSGRVGRFRGVGPPMGGLDAGGDGDGLGTRTGAGVGWGCGWARRPPGAAVCTARHEATAADASARTAAIAMAATIHGAGRLMGLLPAGGAHDLRQRVVAELR